VRRLAIEKLEARAAELAAAGLDGCGADEYPELGIERHGALGQETLHRVGRYVGMVLETGPIPRTARRDPDRKTGPPLRGFQPEPLPSPSPLLAVGSMERGRPSRHRGGRRKASLSRRPDRHPVGHGPFTLLFR